MEEGKYTRGRAEANPGRGAPSRALRPAAVRAVRAVRAGGGGRPARPPPLPRRTPPPPPPPLPPLLPPPGLKSAGRELRARTGPLGRGFRGRRRRRFFFFYPRRGGGRQETAEAKPGPPPWPREGPRRPWRPDGGVGEGRVGEGRPRGRPWGSGPGGVGPWGSGVCLRRTDRGPHHPPSGVGKARGVAGVHRTPPPAGTSVPANSGACGGTWGRGRVNVCGRLTTRGRWWPHSMQTTSWNETGPGPLSVARSRDRGP